MIAKSSPRQRPVFSTAAWVLIVSTAAAASQTSRSIEQFKDYLRSPPPVEDIVFVKKQIANPLYPMPGGLAPTDTSLIYRGAWQSNAFFIQELKSLDDLETFTNRLLLAGAYESSYWHYDPNNDLFKGLNPQGMPRLEAARKYPAYAASLNGRLAMAQAIQLGLLIKPYSLKWAGNTFSAIAYNPMIQEERNVAGELQISNSIPCLAKLTVAGVPGHFSLAFSFTTNVGCDFLPNESRLSAWTEGDGYVPLAAYRFIKVRLAEGELPARLFGPDRFIIPNVTKLTAYTDGQIHKLGQKPLIDPRHILHVRMALLVMLGTPAISILLWILGRRYGITGNQINKRQQT
jgi:hypothetical protein